MLPESERVLRAQLAAHMSWANTEDRTARTANGRRALEDKWLAEANGDPVRVEHLRGAFYTKMALKSAQARRRRAANGSPEMSGTAPEWTSRCRSCFKALTSTRDRARGLCRRCQREADHAG